MLPRFAHGAEKPPSGQVAQENEKPASPDSISMRIWRESIFLLFYVFGFWLIATGYFSVLTGRLYVDEVEEFRPEKTSELHL